MPIKKAIVILEFRIVADQISQKTVYPAKSNCWLKFKADTKKSGLLTTRFSFAGTDPLRLRTDFS